MKKKAEGHKCTVEGCGEAFTKMSLLRSHMNDHNEEFRKRMKCNKSKCGAKFNNQRDYDEHMDKHKERDKAKVINCIRSVLLYNKHGLLMESFQREFRTVTGIKARHVMMGFSSLDDFLTSLPDVVQITNLPEGQSLLLAVPDKATEHIAKMVANQRSNREGFNYRTGEVLKMVSSDTIRKIEKSIQIKARRVPEFIRKQVDQLMNLEMYEEGLELNEFREVYNQEFGYPLEFECYGFYSFEDLVYHGLDGVVELNLDGFAWKLVSTQSFQLKAKASHMQELPCEMKDNIVKLLGDNPSGLSIPTFTEIYEECYGKLNLRQLRCKDGVELCLLNPGVCYLHRAGTGDYTVFPVGKEVHGSNSWEGQGHTEGIVDMRQDDTKDVTEKSDLQSTKYIRDLQRLVLHRLAGIRRLSKKFLGACLDGNLGVAKACLRTPYSLDINYSERAATPLTAALASYSHVLVQLVIDQKGLDVNKAACNRWTPLHLACLTGNTRAIIRLREHSSLDTVNTKDDEGETPIMLAVWEGNTDAVKEMVQIPGIELSTTNRWGDTLVDVCR